MKKTLYWTKNNGGKIAVDDMNLYHLRNALKVMLQNEAVHKEKIKKEIDRIEAVYEKMRIQKGKQRQHDNLIAFLLMTIVLLIFSIIFLIPIN